MVRRRMAGRDLVPPGRAAREPRGILWGVGLVALSVGLAIALAVAAVFSGPGQRYGRDPRDWPLALHLAIDGGAKLLALVAVLETRRWVLKGAPTGEPAPAVRAAAAGVVSGLAFLPIVVGVAFLQKWVYDEFDLVLKGQELVRKAVSEDWSTFFFVAFFAVLLAPPFEEFLFRRLLYGGLRNRFGPAASTLISAALFSLWHMEPDAFPVTFVLGLGLAHLRERTGGLTAPIAMHACYNALQVAGILTARLGSAGG